MKQRGYFMKLTVRQLKQLIREQVEEVKLELEPGEIDLETEEEKIYEVRASHYSVAGRFVGYVRAKSEKEAMEKAMKLGLVEKSEGPRVKRVSMNEVEKKRMELEAIRDRVQEQLDALMNIN